MLPKSRLQQFRQQQKQTVVVNLHLAEKVKRRRKAKRGGLNKSKPLPPAPLQVATPRRTVQQTIHLPPEAIPPQTPFRSQPASHPQYSTNTEHKKKEQELYAKELQMGIEARLAKKLQQYEMTATKPTINKGIKVEYSKPKPSIPFTPPASVIVETPTPLRARRTTVEMNEAIGMGAEDPNPLFAKQAENINVRRLIRRFETPSVEKMYRLDFDSLE